MWYTSDLFQRYICTTYLTCKIMCRENIGNSSALFQVNPALSHPLPRGLPIRRRKSRADRRNGPPKSAGRAGFSDRSRYTPNLLAIKLRSAKNFQQIVVPISDSCCAKYGKFKRPLATYSGTQASTLEHVQGSIEARTKVQKPGSGPRNA